AKLVSNNPQDNEQPFIPSIIPLKQDTQAKLVSNNPQSNEQPFIPSIIPPKQDSRAKLVSDNPQVKPAVDLFDKKGDSYELRCFLSKCFFDVYAFSLEKRIYSLRDICRSKFGYDFYYGNPDFKMPLPYIVLDAEISRLWTLATKHQDVFLLMFFI